jgi:hypothetical protein
MIPPSHLYPWIDAAPARRRRFRAVPDLAASAAAGIVAAMVAGGVSGAAAAVAVLMAALA